MVRQGEVHSGRVLVRLEQVWPTNPDRPWCRRSTAAIARRNNNQNMGFNNAPQRDSKWIILFSTPCSHLSWKKCSDKKFSETRPHECVGGILYKNRTTGHIVFSRELESGAHRLRHRQHWPVGNEQRHPVRGSDAEHVVSIERNNAHQRKIKNLTTSHSFSEKLPLPCQKIHLPSYSVPVTRLQRKLPRRHTLIINRDICIISS